MAKNTHEQLDWLREQDRAQDEDERSRLKEMYGEGAENAPITEKERKGKRLEKINKEKSELRELLDKLKKPFPKIPEN
mgnify:CR=1 FL=1